jgi:protein TonB
MKPELILQADILDIIFEGRNKEYGAYDLRREYNRTMLKALAVVVLLVAGIAVLNYLQRSQEKLNVSRVIPVLDTIILDPAPVVELPRPATPIQRNVATIKHPTFILTNEQVTDSFPTINELAKEAAIGLESKPGAPAIAFDAPSEERNETKKEVVVSEAVKKETKVFDRTEIMPEFPGGQAAFTRFMSKHLRMPDETVQPGERVKILVQFVVVKEGEISDIKFLQTTGEVFEHEVLRVMKKMPRWKPGMQNGEKVSVYFRLPVVFDIPVE